MGSSTDLRQLLIDRREPSATAPRRVWSRWGVPTGIIAGFVTVLGWSARDQWLPAHQVTVAPVMMTRAEVQETGTPLFQAAGWIEPRPTAVLCSALVEGVVQDLFVVEGQTVEAGEPIARLVDSEAVLNLREAESVLMLREAEQDAARAVKSAAERQWEKPVHLEAAYAEAEVELSTLETQLKALPFLIEAAEARRLLAKQDLDGKQVVAESISGRSLQKAKSEFDTAQAALAELEARAPHLRQQHDAWRRKCEALRARMELKTDERRAMDEATASLAAAEARVSQAKLAVERAKLYLERLVIRSPIRGRVLAVHAQPGRRLAGITAPLERDASTVATVYDPERLQVRVDVRLEDVPRVQIGQTVHITTAALKEPLVGEVLGINSQADIQKNTLPVKVSIHQPSPFIRPEMLAQVTFLALPRRNSDSEQDTAPVRLLVPKELVNSDSQGDSVWIVDAVRRVARCRQIDVGATGPDDMIEVKQGLNPLDKLIVSGRDGLVEGTRVRITGSDRQMGTAASQAVTTAAAKNDTNRPPVQ